MELKFGKGSAGQADYTNKSERKRLYLLGGILGALIVMIIIIAFDIYSDELSKQKQIDEFCKSLESQLSVDCKATISESEDEEE